MAPENRNPMSISRSRARRAGKTLTSSRVQAVPTATGMMGDPVRSAYAIFWLRPPLQKPLELHRW